MTTNDATENEPTMFEEPWRMYCDKVEPGSLPWPQNLLPLANVTNARQLWQWLNNLPAPSELLSKSRSAGSRRTSTGYYVFRERVPPYWEHSENLRSGKIILDVHGPNVGDVDRAWNACVCACVGELDLIVVPAENATVPTTDARPSTERRIGPGTIVGCNFNARKDRWRIAVWISRSSKQETQDIIGALAAVLRYPAKSFAYQEHNPLASAPVPAPVPHPVEHVPNQQRQQQTYPPQTKGGGSRVRFGPNEGGRPKSRENSVSRW